MATRRRLLQAFRETYIIVEEITHANTRDRVTVLYVMAVTMGFIFSLNLIFHGVIDNLLHLVINKLKSR